MINLYEPLKHQVILAFCIDDSLPKKFKPLNWIKYGKIYKLKFISRALNMEGEAVTIVDKNNVEIHPNNNIYSFSAKRFTYISICLN